jgi:hypothetical protein
MAFIHHITHMSMNNHNALLMACLSIAAALVLSGGSARAAEKYKGHAWHDSAQVIPGKIQCEYYDTGGEGVAYHDKDSVNNGSGKLNPANGTFLNEFRMNEGVDISYTKKNGIDSTEFNLVERTMGELYVGWTEPGEWINYSVEVKKSGAYVIGLMYTASGNGGIAFNIDGKELTSELSIPSTRSDKETTAWRQWHHWNRIDSLATVSLKKGMHVLTLKTVSNGNMNYDYVQFTSVKNNRR